MYALKSLKISPQVIYYIAVVIICAIVALGALVTDQDPTEVGTVQTMNKTMVPAAESLQA